MDVLDEQIMKQGAMRVLLSKSFIKKHNFFIFLDSIIASGVMKVAGNAVQQLALPLSDTIPVKIFQNQ